MKTCNRRGLFGMLAAPLVAFMDPPAVVAEEKPCAHEALPSVDCFSLLKIGQLDENRGTWSQAEWHFCKFCGEVFTQVEHTPLEPLPASSSGITFRRARQSAHIGNRAWFDDVNSPWGDASP